MNLISGFPEVLLASILMDWLTLKDFGRFDSAMCHKESRVELHSVISTTQHAFTDVWDTAKQPSSLWMTNRGVRCSVIRIRKEVFLDSDLPEQLVMHSGPLLQAMHLILLYSGTGELPGENERRSIDRIITLLDSSCKNLQKIHITSCYEHVLQEKDIAALHGFLCTNNSLHSLQLNAVKPVPMYLIELALTKLKFVSIEDCYVVETPTLQLHETDVKAHFKCINTPLPKKVCAFLTELGLTRLEWNNHDRAQELIASYTKLSHVTVAAHHAEIGPFLAQCICQYWCKLVFLRFESMEMIGEEITMMFIKQLPTLRVLDTAGSIEGVIIKDFTMHINTTTVPSASQLHTLCMYCDRASTLEEILQLCPQLTTLSLTQHQRSTGALGTFKAVEQSLHLLRNSNVRNLELSSYNDLRKEDVAVL